MPYEVIMDATNCDGHAVVKVGTKEAVDGGCHATHQEALDQMTAMNIATADERSQRNEQMVSAIDQAVSILLRAKQSYQEGEPEEEPMEYESRAEVNLVAPAFMKASARRGLSLHEEGYSGDGLRPQTVEDARKMANGSALSPEKWRKISPWIARHTVDLDAVQGDEITAGLVAMLLWGGGSSKSSAARTKAYAERIVAQLEEQREQPRDPDGKFASGGGASSSDESSPAQKPVAAKIDTMDANNAAIAKLTPSTKPVTPETLTMTRDKNIQVAEKGQQGEIANWQVTDSDGNHVGSIKQVREKAPRFAPNPDTNVTAFYSKPRAKITKKAVGMKEIDLHIGLQSSSRDSSKEVALKTLANRHNRILEINASGEGRNIVQEEQRAPAPKKDQIKGSDTNPAGSAKGKSGGIEVSDETETALQNKVTEHNDKMKEGNRPVWTRTTMGALKAVYRRGAGAFSTSHRPGIGRAQWAMARVNAFLVLCRTGRPANSAYTTDNDLLHPEHPKYSKNKKD